MKVFFFFVFSGGGHGHCCGGHLNWRSILLPKKPWRYKIIEILYDNKKQNREILTFSTILKP